MGLVRNPEGRKMRKLVEQNQVDVGVDSAVDLTPEKFRRCAWHLDYKSSAFRKWFAAPAEERDALPHGVSVWMVEGHDLVADRSHYLPQPGKVQVGGDIGGLSSPPTLLVDILEVEELAHALIALVAEARRQDAAKQRWLSRVGA